MSADVSKRTPGPVRIGMECADSGWVDICADGAPWPHIIGSMRSQEFETSRANAAFLALAWNSHDQLVRERDVLEAALQSLLDSPELDDDEPKSIYTSRAVQQARAALASLRKEG